MTSGRNDRKHLSFPYPRKCMLITSISYPRKNFPVTDWFPRIHLHGNVFADSFHSNGPTCHIIIETTRSSECQAIKFKAPDTNISSSLMLSTHANLFSFHKIYIFNTTSNTGRDFAPLRTADEYLYVSVTLNFYFLFRYYDIG
jgi:hypothetical protein